MKKIAIFSALLSVTLLSIGIAIVGCGIGANETLVEEANHSFLAESPCLTLTIEADAAALTVKGADTDVVSVNYYDGDNIATTVSQDDTQIFVSQKTTPPFLNAKAGEITIIIPYEGIDRFTASVKAGECKLSNAKISTITVELDAGNSLLDDLTAENLTSNVNAGKLTAKNVSADEWTAHIDAGKIELNDCKTNRADFRVDTGDIEADFIGQKAEYTLRGKISVGKKNFDNQTGTTEKSISAETSVGNIELNFS